MAEAAASIIGIVAPALHATRVIVDDIKAIKNAPRDLADLLESLELVQAAFRSVESVDKVVWEDLDAVILQLVQGTMKRAGDILETAEGKLKKYKEKKRISMTDRGILGFWLKTDLKDISNQLQTCQGSITSLACIATLHSSIRSTRTIGEVATIASDHKAQLDNALSSVSQRLDGIKEHLKQLQDAKTGPEIPIDNGFLQIQQERDDLLEARKLLQGLIIEAQRAFKVAQKDRAQVNPLESLKSSQESQDDYTLRLCDKSD
ncbi:ATP-nad kinase [Fusarium longipes]|uniref:ATP-nad kinase n=1 Tax=Fusarium longipes TaxID=694270 RepID=A0A395RQW9_9HYPO|nr:ATP-nad kinase [Fusarium longipes]